jgi:hypothetical protein
MTDTNAAAAIATPADLQRAALAKQSADATATLQQLTRDFQSSPDYRVEQLEREIEMLARTEGNGAAVRRASLQSELITAKTEQKAQSVVLTDEQRVDLAMAGKIDHVGAQTTSGQPDNPQLPVEDFVAAVQDDLQLGIRPELVRTFHATGKTDDPNGMDRPRSRPQRPSECAGARQEKELHHATQVHG